LNHLRVFENYYYFHADMQLDPDIFEELPFYLTEVKHFSANLLTVLSG